MNNLKRDLVTFFLVFLGLIALALFASDGQLWTIAKAQGTVPPFVGFPCLDALAFHSVRDGNLEIYIMNGDGSGLSRLTYVNPVDEHPAPSPDGRSIAFDSTRDQANSEIYVMNVDGSNVRRLTISPAADRSPNWSLDAQRIAFESNRDGSFQIWTMNFDGSDLRQLTHGPGENTFPSWSKDNARDARIAFVSTRDGQHEVYVMNAADGSNQTRLTNTPANAGSSHPTWSRDNKRIAFESDRTSNYEIFVMNADGSQVKQITNTSEPAPPKQNRFPYWVPSCDDRIVFSSNRDDPDYRIWVMQPDGSLQRRLHYERPGLLVNPNEPDEHPAWSGAPALLPLQPLVLPTPVPSSTATRVSQLVPGSNSTPTSVSQLLPEPSSTQSTDATQRASAPNPSSSTNPSSSSNSGFWGWLNSIWHWLTGK